MSDRVPGAPVPSAMAAALAVMLSGILLNAPPLGPSAGGAPAREGAPPGAGPQGDRSAAAGVTTATPQDPRRPIEEFWETARPEDGKELADELIAWSRRMDLEFLIASVPDPIDSRFGYRFDAVLDDIQHAIESRGWHLDRFWLPWYPSGQQPSSHDRLQPVLDPADLSAGVELRFDLDRPRGEPLKGTISGTTNRPVDPPGSAPGPRPTTSLHERQPGVLIFRKPREVGDRAQTQRVLILFLVGERPTSGLHKVALGAALNAIRSYEQAAGQPVEIRIVGPYFTGSERSLALAIRHWADRGAAGHVLVRAGGASRIDGAKFVEDAGAGGGLQVTFDATVHDDDDVLRALFLYLKALNGGKSLGKVALLTESDTEYGAILPPPPKEMRDSWGIANVTRMKFPFHISQVALAYAQSKQEDRAAPTPTLVRPSSKLSIPFDEAGSPRDIVPALSPKMASATDEFDLAKILETISMEDYRYVGIIASDTRDVIFLAGLIHEYCPDVQLFTPAGDLLLGHPDYASQLRGMIVASPYPLFSMAQRWDPPQEGDRRRHLFTHQTDQGYFNAAVSLLALGDPDRSNPYFDDMFDYGNPFDEMKDVGLFWGPDGEGHPAWTRQHWRQASFEPDVDLPLWFGVVGHRGIWPLFYLKDFAEPAGPAAAGGDDGGSAWPDLRASHRYAFRPEAPGDPPDAFKFAGQFLPLVPQFTWQWGTIALSLSALIWLVFLAHWESVARGPGSSRAPLPSKMWGILAALAVGLDLAGQVRGAFGFWVLCVLYAGAAVVVALLPALAPAGGGGRFVGRGALGLLVPPARGGWGGAAREGFAVALLVILGATYATFVAWPLWLVVRYSPWVVFGHPDRADLLSGTDLWNWRFGLFIQGAAGVALVACLISLAAHVPGVRGLLTGLGASPIGARGLLLAPIVLGLLGAALLMLLLPVSADPGAHLLFLERAFSLGNGVSPLVPVLLMGTAGVLWAGTHLRRIELRRLLWLDSGPTPETSRWLIGLPRHSRSLRSLVERWLPLQEGAPAYLVGLGLALFAALRVIERFTATVDGPVFSGAMKAALVALLLAIVGSLCRYLLIWGRLRAILRELSRLPMQRAFDRLPASVSRDLGRYLNAGRPQLANLTPAVQQWALVAKGSDARIQGLINECEGLSDGQRAALRGKPEDILARYWSELTASGPSADLAGSPTRMGIRRAALACLRILEDRWDDRPLAEAYGDAEPQAAGGPPGPKERTGTPVITAALVQAEIREGDGASAESIGTTLSVGEAAPRPGPSDEPTRRWVERAEELVALEIIAFLRQGMIHLQNLTPFLTLGPILLLLATTSYPFQPQRFLIVIIWAVLIAAVACLVAAYVQMERDALLSRIAKTTPNQLTLDRSFLSHILTVLLPLAGLVLAQFPYVSDSLNEWFDPILRVLK